MRSLKRVLVVALALAGIVLLATPAAGYAVPRHRCAKTYTLSMFERAAHAIYASGSEPSRRQYGALWKFAHCQRPPSSERRALRSWDRIAGGGQMNGPVTASWFDDSGGTSCGIHATYGFATLLNIPCGATIRMRGPSGRVVMATREDSGPYVGGRTFDLNPALRDALGCGDMCYGNLYWR